MKTLAATAAAVTATAAAGSLATDSDSEWYRSLRTPAFQPPPAAFPIVWTGLYAGIAAGSAEAIDRLPRRRRRAFVAALATNLTLNAGWSWCFFHAHRPWLSTAVSGALTASTADLARRARAASPRAHALLAPYLAWTAYATVLSADIARLNPRSRD